MAATGQIAHNLSALYDLYFTVVPAYTVDLLDQAFALRYVVYCVENPYEDPARSLSQREMDMYDTHSVHAVLIHKASGKAVGCVRLVLPAPAVGLEALPIWDLLNDEPRLSLKRCPPRGTAEISRYAVSKMFRRREGETQYPDTGFFDIADHSRRLVPHITLGLMRGVGRLAADYGMTHVCAVMAPALLRLLERFGISFEPLGAPVEHHGLRQPCVAECSNLLSGLGARNPDYYQVVNAAYRSA
jgi:N-acyl amino acid synthase of PEP-CTERM/exosortase system